MKIKHILAIFLIGVVFSTTGTLFKINHWPGGSLLFLIATLLKLAALIAGIWKLFRMQLFRDFLNS